MSRVLDISGRSPLSPTEARRIEAVAEELRHSFIELVDQMSLQNIDNIDWWVLPLATRNTFTSPFFMDCCRARMLDDLLSSPPQGLETVVVGSPGMARVAQKIVKQRGSTCCIEFDRGIYLRQVLFRTFRNFFGAAVLSVSQWVFANILVNGIKNDKLQPLILVDTFLYPNSIRGGKFFDRHFPGIETELDPNELNRLFYFPTFYGTRNFAAAFHQLRKLKTNFLLKEHYLRITDYLYALGHGLRIFRLKLADPLVLGEMDVSAIAQDNLGVHCSPPSVIEALLKYRAIDRMHQAGLRISRVIGWFENQDINRAVNAGFRRFYPNCSVIGYVGYVPSSHYLCAKPTSTELAAAVLPTRVAVMGRGFIEAIREYAPGLDVGVAPALRYQHLFVPLPRQTESAQLEILVALPVVRTEALEVIAAVRSSIPGIRTSTRTAIKVVIKPHPATIILSEHLSSLSDDPEVLVEWSNDRLDHLLARADVMISTASSACFEALALGVPAVVIGNLKGLTYVSIPRGVPEGLWQLFYPGESLAVAVETLRHAWASARANGTNAAAELRETYLEPVTSNGIRELIVGVSN